MVKVTNPLGVSEQRGLEVKALAQSIFRDNLFNLGSSTCVVLTNEEGWEHYVIADIDFQVHKMVLHSKLFYPNALRFAEKYEKEFLTGYDKGKFEIITDYSL